MGCAAWYPVGRDACCCGWIGWSDGEVNELVGCEAVLVVDEPKPTRSLRPAGCESGAGFGLVNARLDMVEVAGEARGRGTPGIDGVEGWMAGGAD